MDLSVIDWEDILQATLDTLTMTGVSLAFAVAFGLPLGVLLFLTSKRQLLEQNWVYQNHTSFDRECLRSVPFIIFVDRLIPLTLLLGRNLTRRRWNDTAFGDRTTPFFARLVENVLRRSGSWGVGSLRAIRCENTSNYFTSFVT